jgi:hypothetical protein
MVRRETRREGGLNTIAAGRASHSLNLNIHVGAIGEAGRDFVSFAHDLLIAAGTRLLQI